MSKVKPNLFVVIPNLNGRRNLGEKEFSKCLNAVLNQSQKCTLIVVDNGSDDNSEEYIHKNFPSIVVIRNEENHGFAGGVNDGIRYAISKKADAVALMNSDAIANQDWLEQLWVTMQKYPEAGITTGKFLKQKPKNEIDSTGDLYSIWGTAYPRGRGEQDTGQFDDKRHEFVFGATGGASLYRVKMLNKIGLFDETFFAYYEDVDISFRAQLQGWKAVYTPKALAYHGLSKTSATMPGFINYHALKNLVPLYTKNMPGSLYWRHLWRFILVLSLTYYKTLRMRLFKPALKALLVTIIRLPSILIARWQLQRKKVVSAEYINSILIQAIPPSNSHFFEKVIKKLHLGKTYDEIDV